MLRFDPFFPDVDRLMRQLWGSVPGGDGRPSLIAMDAWRHGDQFVVELDLPGIAPDSIDVNVDHDVLTIQAERPEPKEGPTWLLAERPYGVFRRRLSLSTDLATDKITADYTDGVLRVTIPVAETAKPRKIAVVPGPQKAAINA